MYLVRFVTLAASFVQRMQLVKQAVDERFPIRSRQKGKGPVSQRGRPLFFSGQEQEFYLSWAGNLIDFDHMMNVN